MGMYNQWIISGLAAPKKINARIATSSTTQLICLFVLNMSFSACFYT